MFQVFEKCCKIKYKWHDLKKKINNVYVSHISTNRTTQNDTWDNKYQIQTPNYVCSFSLKWQIANEIYECVWKYVYTCIFLLQIISCTKFIWLTTIKVRISTCDFSRVHNNIKWLIIFFLLNDTRVYAAIIRSPISKMISTEFLLEAIVVVAIFLHIIVWNKQKILLL